MVEPKQKRNKTKQEEKQDGKIKKLTDKPAISLKETPAPPSTISSRISAASFESIPLIGAVMAAFEGAVC